MSQNDFLHERLDAANDRADRLQEELDAANARIEELTGITTSMEAPAWLQPQAQPN